MCINLFIMLEPAMFVHYLERMSGFLNIWINVNKLAITIRPGMPEPGSLNI